MSRKSVCRFTGTPNRWLSRAPAAPEGQPNSRKPVRQPLGPAGPGGDETRQPSVKS
jgi:hypothetical protein